MLANEQLILSAALMLLIVSAILVICFIRRMNMDRVRGMITRKTAVDMLCDGGYFDLKGLLKICRLSSRTRNERRIDDCYIATFCGKKRIRLTLKRVGGDYVLINIERYLDINKQLAGWHECYIWEDMNDTKRYIAPGEDSLSGAIRKHRLPTFLLTRRAIGRLCEECADDD